MIVVFFLVLLGFGYIFRTRIMLWITAKRMALRHYLTLMKIEALKSLHDNGFI